MSRSEYTEDCTNFDLYRGTVKRSIAGERGQAFLLVFAKALDALKEKRLISGQLSNHDGEVCGLGAVFKLRRIAAGLTAYEDNRKLAGVMGISRSMCAEIEYMNDEWAPNETPEQRWTRMRKWIDDNIILKKWA